MGVGQREKATQKRVIKLFAQELGYTYLGDFTALPAKLEILASRADFASARVTVQEGKFHQVKRMFAACGRTVVRRERLRVGPITLDPALAPGQLRELTPEEEAALYQAVSADGCV